MSISTGKELAAAAKRAATEQKSLYVMGCFGAPMTDANKQRYIGHHSYNQRSERAAKIRSVTADTFGFDCVCLIKGLLWGWDGDTGALYGGAQYTANGVPDIGEDAMIAACSGVSADFSAVAVGEMLYSPGHCGIYLGDGLAVEATPAWADGVQITAVGNLGAKAGYPTRTWQKHGKLPYVRYTQEAAQGGPQSSGITVPVNLRVLSYGATGEAVKALQALLNGQGYGLDTDGSFGGKTLAALKAYQQAKGLAVDGSCGPATWGSLLGV